tara:strand:+ start:208 stop:636 length:429 start_codon:yes stop_codon:yes gene_type:complete
MKRKRLEEKRRRASKSPGMNKRLNASGATGAKGSDRGAAMSAEMMAQDPARGGVDPANERAKAALAGMKKGGMAKKGYAAGGMKKKGFKAGGMYGEGAMEKQMKGKKKGFAAGGMKKKGYKKGGKVRGAGIARKGVRPVQMR